MPSPGSRTVSLCGDTREKVPMARVWKAMEKGVRDEVGEVELLTREGRESIWIYLSCDHGPLEGFK